MSAPSYSATIGVAKRRRFILRHGILRYGLILGTLVFGWVVSGEYGGVLEHLRTRAGWLRLAFILLLSLGEWVIGAGWLIGCGLWYLHQHPLPSGPGRSRPSPPPSGHVRR